MGSGRARADGSTYYHPHWSTHETANQHSTRRPSASFHLIAPVMARSFKFAFVVHVRIAPRVSVNQRGIDGEALAGW